MLGGRQWNWEGMFCARLAELIWVRVPLGVDEKKGEGFWFYFLSFFLPILSGSPLSFQF